MEWKEMNRTWSLNCPNSECAGLLACIHMYDQMTASLPEDLQVPDGKVRLPMAGEFPNVAQAAVSTTVEKLGSFDVQVSQKLNGYGMRKLELVTVNGPVFLMMLNPEDSIVSIYQVTREFVNNQVDYLEGDRFGNCKAPSHRMDMQLQLARLEKFVDTVPMLKMWDLLSKLQTASCIVCMWKRTQSGVAAGNANASGLGNL